MLSKLEIELQTARHIAGNRSNKSQRAVIFFLLAWCVGCLGLYLFTPVGIGGAFIVSILVACIAGIPLYIFTARRDFRRKAEVDRIRAEQLKRHRAKGQGKFSFEKPRF